MLVENAVMKPCGYCGRENNEDASHCQECGTSISGGCTEADLDTPVWNPHTPLGLALTSGLGSLLIGTAAVFLAGRIMGDIFELLYPADTDNPVISVGMFFRYSRELLGAVGVAFIFGACHYRCKRSSHAITTGIATSVVFLSITFLPMLVAELFVVCWLLPVTILGVGTGTSLGFYAGAAVQIGAGAWLLGVFEMWRRTPDEGNAQPNAATEPPPAATVLRSSETMNTKSDSKTPTASSG